ncbi:MAG: hypothetical protein HQ513_13565 [Rhodospirillales bacterium]|nr:hypothetical protein [Rhodospirillales bacterium]
MNNSDPTQQMAFQVPRGHAVHRPGADQTDTVFIKAERLGTEYIHHYLIQIAPMQADGLAMIYVDPEEMLIDCGAAPHFEYSDGESRDDPGIGHIFENSKGTYLKVIEDPKSQKMFAFIDISSGEVKRRQERHVKTVYVVWQVSIGAF